MRTKSFIRARDALSQLQLDHEAILQLLRDFDSLRQVDREGVQGKAELVDCLCDTLILHAQIKEEIFYPVVRSELGCDTQALAAFCHHETLYRLIAQLDEMGPRDEAYDEVVAQIGDWVISSLDREQSVLFTRVRGAGLNTAALSKAMARRRRAQQQEYTGQDLLELRRA
jgi:hypothetical protein